MANISENRKKTVAIVLSGGRGSRMGSDIPKQYLKVCDYPIIYYSLKVFQDSFVDEIVLVCAKGDEEYCRREIVEAYDFNKVTGIVAGGSQRYHSVMNGLRAIEDCDIVFIHDGARPFINEEILERAYKETLEYKATVVAVPSKDTVKLSDMDGYSEVTPNRERVWIVQTPQTFDFHEIKDAYEKCISEEDNLVKEGISITDDAMVMERFGNTRIKFVNGSYKNIKITTPEDMLIARVYLEAEQN